MKRIFIGSQLVLNLSSSLELKTTSLSINLLSYVDDLGISKREFYSISGISRGTLESKTGITEDTITKFFATYPDINPTWLLTGEGSMLQGSGGAVVQEAVATGNKGGIPLVEQRVVAGFGGSSFAIEERDVKDWYVIPKFKHKKIDFMIEVEGASMYPKYNSGDVVACKIIKADRFIQWNKAHVVATKDQGIIIKRLKPGSSDDTLTLVSDNSNYDPFEVLKEDISGIALVVGVIRLE